MSKFTAGVGTAVAAIAAALALVAVLHPSAGTGSVNSARGSWWGPPQDVKTLLRSISASNLRTDDVKLVSFGTRHTLSSQNDPNRGIGAARDWILSQMQQIAATTNGQMTVAQQSYVQPPAPRIPTPTVITNLVATLHGTDPSSADRVYVVGAHYDDRVTDVSNFTDDAPGANKDGSGVAAVLELARVFAAHPPKATVEFVAFAGEEQGLFGSNFFAQTAKSNGVKIQAMLDLDTLGSPVGGNGFRDPNVVRVFNEGVPTAETAQQKSQRQAFGGENDGVSRQLARYVEETGANSKTGMSVRSVYRRQEFRTSSDFVSFLQQGYPAVWFTEPDDNLDHLDQDVRVENGTQFGDLPEFVDFDYLARATRVVASTLAALTRAPRAPSGVTEPLTPSYDTQLSWTASPDSDVTGYEVVWRDSTESEWTHSRLVGNVTSATIANLDKDDNMVGVRAVDAAGDRSPVATP